MNYVQQKEAELKTRVIPQTGREDFEIFWRQQVSALRGVDLKVERKLLDLPYKTFRAYEITFNTHDQTEVTAYFCVPNTYDGKKLPCVVNFHGGGGRFGILPHIVSTGVCTFFLTVFIVLHLQVRLRIFRTEVRRLILPMQSTVLLDIKSSARK